MTTNDLIRIWDENNRSSQSKEVFELISELLEKRNAAIPPRTKFQIKPVNFPVDSNASVKMVAPTKTEIIFPRDGDGYMRLGQFKFKNEDEMEAYLGGTFQTDNETSRFKGGTIKRRGRYKRIDESGNPCITFGDPVLDLITDKDGITYISGKMLDLKLVHATARQGGISPIDLNANIADIRKYQLTDSVSGNSGFTLGESNGKVTTYRSSNPERWFREEGTNNEMRFRTFRHNRGLWKSLGCEIETWGGSDAHFSSARIDSWYGNVAIGYCTYAKYDNDSDTNDAFLDEYEVASIGASLPSGVKSYCTANWRNMQRDGIVWDTCENVVGQPEF
jgi:hypothetical protein